MGLKFKQTNLMCKRLPEFLQQTPGNPYQAFDQLHPECSV